ncbi:hypothetical protein ACIQNU_32530 [Streptomyces sp. NPDC091292]|uniref:hypothetical protein n=1 Tax=Streptomyces sp. NPDC091292 TaxID=3365991 RepID=UPI00381A50C6
MPTLSRTPRGLRRAAVLLSLLAATTLPTAVVAAPAACAEACGGAVVVAPLSTAPPATGPCTSAEPVVCQIRAETPEERREARAIRMNYLALIGEMDRVRCDMRAAGRSPEEIARHLVDMRNDAKEITRAGMSADEVRQLEARNIAKYGNPLGPTADQLYAKYGTWEQVADAATRTSRAVDGELGLEYRPCPCELPVASSSH